MRIMDVALDPMPMLSLAGFIMRNKLILLALAVALVVGVSVRLIWKNRRK